MVAKLSEELALELERVGEEPLRVENPRNNKRYVIVAEERFPIQELATQPLFTGEWTGEKNVRRFVLIDKQIAKTISADETNELRQLELEVDSYLDRVAPLPLAAARELHERLRRSLSNTKQP